MKALVLFVILMLSQGCAYWDPFASFEPLLARLDETKLSAKARSALAEARYDFALARKDKPPRFAHLIGDDPRPETRTYQGNGYQLTIFNGGPHHRVGQSIVVESAITGGKPCHYDEIYEETQE